jgi:hypothetical protein
MYTGAAFGIHEVAVQLYNLLHTNCKRKSVSLNHNNKTENVPHSVWDYKLLI